MNNPFTFFSLVKFAYNNEFTVVQYHWSMLLFTDDWWSDTTFYVFQNIRMCFIYIYIYICVCVRFTLYVV
jgi:hypothetical protein